MQSAKPYEFESSESEEESSDTDDEMAPGSGLTANQLQELVEKIKTLEEQVMQNHETIAALEEARAKGGVKIKVETFDGDRTKLEAFLSQLDVYFNYNPVKTQVDRNLKITTFMSGRALTWVQPYLESWFQHGSEHGKDTPHGRRIAIFGNKTKFVEALRLNWGHVEAKAQAAQDIKRMKQKGSATTHAMEFERRAMLLDWGDEALAEAFYDTLKEEVKDEISRIEKRPTTLVEMKKHAIRIDNRMYERRMERRGYQRHSANTGQRRERRQEYRDPYGHVPMELDATIKSKGSKRDDKPKKKFQGKCYNCQKEGHMARSCPEPKREKMRATKAEEPQQLWATHRRAMSDAPEWEVTDDEEPSEHVREFERIITAEAYDQVEIPEMTQMKPHESVWEWIDNEAAAFGDVTKAEHRSLSWKECKNSTGKDKFCHEHQIEHEAATWKECEEFHEKLECIKCAYHANQKDVDIRQKDHPRHEEFPGYACDETCNIHRDEHREFIHMTRTNAEFMYHGDYGCEIANCTRCNEEPSSGEEEYFDAQDPGFPNHPNHAATSWAFCYDDDCPIHISEKEGGDYFPRPPKRYLRATISTETPEIEEPDFPDQDAKLQEAKKELEEIQERLTRRMYELSRYEQNLRGILKEIQREGQGLQDEISEHFERVAEIEQELQKGNPGGRLTKEMDPNDATSDSENGGAKITQELHEPRTNQSGKDEAPRN
jgi:hypothetical protein